MKYYDSKEREREKMRKKEEKLLVLNLPNKIK